MEAMFSNSEMMANMSSMMANLTPEDMQRMSAMAGSFGSGVPGAICFIMESCSPGGPGWMWSCTPSAVGWGAPEMSPEMMSQAGDA